MTWPTVPIVTTSMDAGTDTPPRDQIKAMADAINEMIATPPVASPSSGRLLGVQVFTANGTYTPITGTSSVVVEMVGGGGAGGGSQLTNASQVAAAPGGDAGCYLKFRLTSGFAGAAITIGAGGVGAAYSTGGAGGQTTFAGSHVCFGGVGGSSAAAVASSGQGFQANATAWNSSHTGSTGLISVLRGRRGQPGVVVHSASGHVIGGAGGDSFFGLGGLPRNLLTDSSGANSAISGSYGAGGGGAMSAPSTASNVAGGNGAPGVVVVWEYA